MLKNGHLFLFLFMRWFVEIGASQDECKVSRCSDHGPVMRFPFQLKDQPYRCGYPGFEISCIEKKLTILELPSVSLSVKKINYNSQEIIVHEPDFCLQRQLQNLTWESKVALCMGQEISLHLYSHHQQDSNNLK